MSNQDSPVKSSQNIEKPQKGDTPSQLDEDNVCFVISPIGKTGSEEYTKFKEVLDYVIKPAVKNSGYKLKVIRADDIERAGSFIKDILQNLLDSYVVIADLTGKNPNVFYELGVRHSLSPRTILIAQSLEDIPSDLREYRTIVYDTTAKGAATFQTRLAKYLEEIYSEPNRPDNPVQDRIGSILEQNRAGLERENLGLKRQIESILKKGTVPKKRTDVMAPVGEERALTRVQRILRLIGAQRNYSPSVTLATESAKDKKSYYLPREEGYFEQYAGSASGRIRDYVWYFAVVEDDINWERDLADIRVLMEEVSKRVNIPCKFIIVTNADVAAEKKRTMKAFDKMKSFIKVDQRKLFELEIWDKTGLLKKEKELGVKVDV